MKVEGKFYTPAQIAEMLVAERERCALALDRLKAEETHTRGEASNDILWAYRKALREIRNLGAAP